MENNYKAVDSIDGLLAAMERIREALDEGRFEEFRNKYSPLLASKATD